MEDRVEYEFPVGWLGRLLGGKYKRARSPQYSNYESIVRMPMAWLESHGAGLPAGDVQRRPGVFLLVEGQIRKSYGHALVSDRPDCLAMATA